MPKSAKTTTASPDGTANRKIVLPVVILIVQSVAGAYFGVDLEVMMECLVAFALLAGIVMGSRYLRGIHRELRWKEQSLAKARGALSEHIALRFAEWDLSPGERDVALFALKGFEIAEIARLRGAITAQSDLRQGRREQPGDARLPVY